jgi:death-on-curing protein
LALHERLVADFGGLAGVRDCNLSASAMARPGQLAAYAQASIVDFAPGHTTGIVRNHPFIDGNKRVGFLLASGALGEADFARWLKDNSEPA